MIKKEKLLKKIMAVPPKKDITYNELESFLKSNGYKKDERSGSRVSFYNKEFDHLIHLHKPHPGKELKLYQVIKIQKKIKEVLK